MALIPALPTTWAAGDVLTASALNTNFTTIRDAVNTSALFKDVAAQTVSVGVTFSAAQTFSAGITITGALTMATAASTLVPGATSFSIRNNADSADNLLVSNAGAVTVRNGLTVTAGGATITAGGLTVSAGTTAVGDLTVSGTFTPAGITINGNLTFSGTNRTILPGTTSLIVRNVGDTATAFTVSSNSLSLGSAGVQVATTGLTVTGNLTFSGADRTILPGTTTFTVRNVGDTGNAIQVVTNNVTLGSAGVHVTIASPSGPSATGPFLFLGSVNGTPTGVGVANGALIMDNTNFKLYVRLNSTWREVALV